MKNRVAAIAGWFETDSEKPHLLGSRCCSCGSYFFPKETGLCRNPGCQAAALEEARLSRTGTLWSYANNCYKPPAPYVSPEPFEPYAVAAVELAKEKIVVLGQVVAGVSVTDLRVGMEMELVLGELFEDAENEYLVWKWRPLEPKAEDRP